jgi:hypothetical protein
LVFRLLDRFKDILPQPFATNGAVVALEIGILLGLTGLDIFEPNIAFLSSFHQLTTDLFCAVTPSE